MVILQSKSKYSQLLELNQSDDTYRETLRVPIDGIFPNIEINGVFDFLSGALVALYADAGHMILRIGSKVIPFEKGLEIVVNGEKSNRRLTVNQNGTELASLRYSISETPAFDDDYTAFVDNENFDFGQFVANIASNIERQRVALENWMN